MAELVDPAKGRRAADQADAEVTQHRRQVDAAEQGNHHQRGGQNDQQIIEQREISLAFSSMPGWQAGVQPRGREA